MNYCKKCSRLIDSDVSICPFCGNNLEETGQQSVSPLIPPAGAAQGIKADIPSELSPPLKELSDLMDKADEEKTVRMTQDFSAGNISNINANAISDEPKRYTTINPTPQVQQITPSQPPQGFGAGSGSGYTYAPQPTPAPGSGYTAPQPTPAPAASYGFTPAPSSAPAAYVPAASSYPKAPAVTSVYVNNEQKAAYPASYDETEKEIGLGLRIFLYVISLVAPVIATIVGIVYINKPRRSDKVFGQSLVIITCIQYAFIILGICAVTVLISTGATMLGDFLNNIRYYY